MSNLRILLWLVLVPVVPVSQVRIDDQVGAFRRQQQILYLWSGEHVRRLSDGLRNLMADVYWLRTVQYFGAQHAFATEQRFDLLRPLIEITVSLDRRFEIAYRYGATFLSEPRPTGAGDPQAGIEILERGCRALPHSWRMRQDLAFAWFIYMKDPRRGAEILLEASRLPGAPIWLDGLAADFLRRGGDRQTSRVLWKRVYEQSDEGAIRGNALFHLQRLDALDAVDRLNALVEEFVKRTGRRPRSLGELVASRLLRFVPVDPSGVPFEYDAREGRVSISRQSRLWRRAEA